MTNTLHESPVLGDWLARIEAMHPEHIEMGLGRLHVVADRLGVTSLPMPVITVAGTNGKGSTIALLQALVAPLDLPICVYTSPHIHVFNERVRLPSGLAGDDALCEAFDAVDAARGSTSLTYFEFTTLAALWLFARSDAKLAILEIGLGGRLDAVNIVEPDVAVVTSIGLDHQDWLGDNREAIAAEKLGVARAGKPLVFGDPCAPNNLDALLDQYQPDTCRFGNEYSLEGNTLKLASGQTLRLPEQVPLGQDNLATACQALCCAGLTVTDEMVALAGRATLAGRCEPFKVNGVKGWFDVGHNTEAVSRFLRQLPDCKGQRYLVFSILEGKPLDKIVALLPNTVVWYLAPLSVPRATSVVRMQAALPESVQQYSFTAIAEAFDSALAAATEDDQVLVFGSFYTVADAKMWLTKGSINE